LQFILYNVKIKETIKSNEKDKIYIKR